MKKSLLLALFILGMTTIAFAQTRTTTARLLIQEEDGSPSGRPASLKVSNTSLTDNGDGTFSLSSGAAATTGTSLSLSDHLTVAGNAQFGNNVNVDGTLTASAVGQLFGAKDIDATTILLLENNLKIANGLTLAGTGTSAVIDWTPTGNASNNFATDGNLSVGSDLTVWGTLDVQGSMLMGENWVGNLSVSQDLTVNSQIVVQDNPTGVQVFLDLAGTGAFAGSEPAIDFRNTAGSVTTARISSKPGSGYANSEMTIAVANASKTLTDRMLIDVVGDVTINQDLTVTGAVYNRGAKLERQIMIRVETAKIGHLATPATIDAGNNRFRLLFDASQTESAEFYFRLPSDYIGNPKAILGYSMASATSNKVDLEVAVMAVSDGDAADVDTDSFDTVNEITGGTTVPGTAGYLDVITIPLANFDSGAAGDYMILKINRDHDDTDDTATGDLELRFVEFTYNI